MRRPRACRYPQSSQTGWQATGSESARNDENAQNPMFVVRRDFHRPGGCPRIGHHDVDEFRSGNRGRAQEPRDAFQKQVLPLLERYCIDCHVEEESRGGNRPGSLRQSGGGGQGRADLDPRAGCASGTDHAARRTSPNPRSKSGTGSSPGSKMTSWPPNARKQASSAPVVIRRLNRQEYNNTIRDLLGLDLHLADDFPPDDIGFGFDNVGSALNISPVHVEKYLDAAEARPAEGDRLARRQGLLAHRADRLEDVSAPAERAGRVQACPETRAVPGRFQPGARGNPGIGPAAQVGDRVRQGSPHGGCRPGPGRDGRLSLLAEGRGRGQPGPCRAGSRPGRGCECRQAQGGRRQRERRQALWGRDRVACRLDGRARARPDRRPSSFPSRIGGSCSARPNTATNRVSIVPAR